MLGGCFVNNMVVFGEGKSVVFRCRFRSLRIISHKHLGKAMNKELEKNNCEKVKYIVKVGHFVFYLKFK